VKPNSWNDILDATQEKSHCYGIDSITKEVTGSEDGLYLNIFTKDVNPSKPFPVMVYIHGGAFLGGSSALKSYSPDYFLMADVVLVTFNYRVGPLGFLHLDDPSLEVPGNAGLKDQLMALKFVKENIMNFGGDVNNITLLGHSAGGASVSWHCISDISRNLFHRAIIMSGCALNLWAFTPKRDWALRLAKAVGYDDDKNGSNERDILEFLQKADPVKMTEVQKKLIRPDEFGKIDFAFAPHIEPYTTKNSFITTRPIDLVRKAWSNNIDILIGGTSDEGIMYLEALRAMPNLLASLKLKNMVPVDVSELSSDDPIRLNFAEKLQQAYYSSSSSDPTKDELAFCTVSISDFYFITIANFPPNVRVCVCDVGMKP
jgi:carboxylesterase type B